VLDFSIENRFSDTNKGNVIIIWAFSIKFTSFWRIEYDAETKAVISDRLITDGPVKMKDGSTRKLRFYASKLQSSFSKTINFPLFLYLKKFIFEKLDCHL
jgi:hypothetical protein